MDIILKIMAYVPSQSNSSFLLIFFILMADSPKTLLNSNEDLGEMWKLVPAFIRSKGLIRQHLSSFNHFIEHEIAKILDANREVRPTKNDKIFLRYSKIRVDPPTELGNNTTRPVTPQECRLRDLTYLGGIRVLFTYTKQSPDGKIITKTGSSRIGGIPIMVRSHKCCLHGKPAEHLVRAQECPHDPGGLLHSKWYRKGDRGAGTTKQE